MLPLPDLANGLMAAPAQNVCSPEYGDFSG
jgi:hypothetical protein